MIILIINDQCFIKQVFFLNQLIQRFSWNLFLLKACVNNL